MKISDIIQRYYCMYSADNMHICNKEKRNGEQERYRGTLRSYDVFLTVVILVGQLMSF